jgi:hypothetical protein
MNEENDRKLVPRDRMVIRFITYNYLCNQCISPLNLLVRIPFRRGVLDTTLHDKDLRQIGGFPPPIKLTQRYNWNIVESGVKQHNSPSEFSDLIIYSYAYSGGWSLVKHVHVYEYISTAYITSFNIYYWLYNIKAVII